MTTSTMQPAPSPADAAAHYRVDPRATTALRPYPYPYRAMLAICSDLDETPDRDVYWKIMRFLNGSPSGLGLEVGNTIYFDMPPDQFSYWGTDDAGREMVRNLIHSGHIDCLHSFGDLATTRDHARRAIDELTRHGCRLEVWVDHSKAPSNLGDGIMVGSGDVTDSPVYHADLTLDYGIKYVWRGRVTSVIGQNRQPSLRGIWNSNHPITSAKTVAKEAAKGALARRGNATYAMHARNELLRDVTLRDGRPAVEFLRCNPYWGGVGQAATAAGLGHVLTRRFLDRLVARRGACVLYTHMGKITDPAEPFNPHVQSALSLLADYQRRGDILVTTTRRLLGYHRAMRDVRVRTVDDHGTRRIEIDTWAASHDRSTNDHDPPASVTPSDLDGLTIYVADPSTVTLSLNDRPLEMIERNDKDETGRTSVSLPWPRLRFPDS